MQKGVARLADEAEGEERAPVLGPAEVHSLRSRLTRGRLATRATAAKVFVCGAGPQVARRFLSSIPGLLKVAAEPSAVKSGFGTLGRLPISDALQIDFLMIPPTEAARPLWKPFCANAVGAMLLDASESAVKVASYFAREIRVPLVVVGRNVPPPLQNVPAGAAAVGEDLPDALRFLLLRAIEPVGPNTESR